MKSTAEPDAFNEGLASFNRTTRPAMEGNSKTPRSNATIIDAAIWLSLDARLLSIVNSHDALNWCPETPTLGMSLPEAQGAS
jgi:hypothetical protein